MNTSENFSYNLNWGFIGEKWIETFRINYHTYKTISFTDSLVTILINQNLKACLPFSFTVKYKVNQVVNAVFHAKRVTFELKIGNVTLSMFKLANLKCMHKPIHQLGYLPYKPPFNYLKKKCIPGILRTNMLCILPKSYVMIAYYSRIIINDGYYNINGNWTIR